MRLFGDSSNDNKENVSDELICTQKLSFYTKVMLREFRY